MYGPGGISQGLLGQWLGLQQPQISRIETGSPIRDLDTLVYWARVLKIPPEMLWFDLPGETRQAVASVLESSVDSLSDDDRSHELVELLNSLTASRFPVLDDQHTKRVGVSALEGASLSERAQLILRLFCNWTMSSVVMSCIYHSHGMLPALASVPGSAQRMVWLPLGS